MAAAVAAYQSAGMSVRPHPPLKFVCCFGGTSTSYPRHLEAMKEKIQVGRAPRAGADGLGVAGAHTIACRGCVRRWVSAKLLSRARWLRGW